MINTKEGIVFFDTETTGIIKNNKGEITSNGSLIQLAYRKIKDSKKIDENLFFMTDTKIEIAAMAIHGIYPDLLRKKSNGKYLGEEDREQLSKTMTENIIVAHNIDFDKDVLEKEDIKYTDRMIDTLKVAKIMWSEGVLQNESGEDPEFMNLQYLRYFFGLYEIKDENGIIECTTAHDAFGDVVVLENVFYELFKRIKEKLEISDTEVLEKMIEMTKKEFILVTNMRIGKYRGVAFEEIVKNDRGYLEWMLKGDFTEDLKYTAKVHLGLLQDKKFFS